MKRVAVLLVMTIIGMISSLGFAYEPYYIKQQTYKNDVSILKKEAAKFNENYRVFYTCSSDICKGFDKIPTMFVLVIDKANRTMTLTAYGCVWSEEHDQPAFQTFEMPMEYAGYEIKQQSNSLVVIEEKDGKKVWSRLNGFNGKNSNYQHLGTYTENSSRNLRDISFSRCDNFEMLNSAYEF